MSGFKLPRQKGQGKIINLKDYGGEGEIEVKPVRVMDSIALSHWVTELAKKDDIPITNEKQIGGLINTKYKVESILFFLSRCVFAIEGDVKRRLSEEEIEDLPPQLTMDLLTVINEGSDFPLVQSGGAGQK